MRSIDARLESMKREIDSLQEHLHATRQPWYRSLPTVISLFAFCFSFGTTVLSFQRTRQLDIQAARAELRGFIKRLAELPRENLQLTKTYANEQMVLRDMQSFITQETILVANQAAEVIRRIPAQVSATEYSAVAYALWTNASNAAALELIRKAVAKASDAVNEAAVLRQYAEYLMMSGDVNGARVEYQKALAVFSKYPGHNQYYQDFTHAFTQLHWARTEANLGNFRELKLHLDEAEEIARRLNDARGNNPYQQQIEQMRQWLPGAAAPSSGPLPLPAASPYSTPSMPLAPPLPSPAPSPSAPPEP